MDNEKTTVETALDILDQKCFGPKARSIVRACASEGPQNPYDYFGKSIRRNWAYAYFDRLEAAGVLVQVPPPAGRRGYRWYDLAPVREGVE